MNGSKRMSTGRELGVQSEPEPSQGAAPVNPGGLWLLRFPSLEAFEEAWLKSGHKVGRKGMFKSGKSWEKAMTRRGKTP